MDDMDWAHGYCHHHRPLSELCPECTKEALKAMSKSQKQKSSDITFWMFMLISVVLVLYVWMVG